MYTESTNVFENCFVIHHFSYILLSASSGPVAMLGAWVPHLNGPLHQHWEWYQIKRIYIRCPECHSQEDGDTGFEPEQMFLLLTC